MRITSLGNKIYKRALKLKDKKYRDEFDAYLVEGERGVSDTDASLIETIFVDETVDLSRFDESKTFVLPKKLILGLTGTVNSCGVIAVAKKKPERDFELPRILYLDRIRDPGNMGTMIRSAVAAGYEIVCDNCVDVYNQKVVRSCVSALSKARLHCGNFIDNIAEKGYNIIGADVSGKCIFDCSKPTKYCLVIGNEANGIRQDIIDKCDIVCSVPMENMESLNASVCAGILMYYFRF